MKSDWHPADVQAALKKLGIRVDSIGPSIGLNRTAGYRALYSTPWPRVKAEIARLLGHRPQEIWPSIFDENGQPHSQRRPHSNASKRARNVCRTVAERRAT
ncbi:MAG: helix-turn-helix domain-containing protein [Rhodospirillales bacterium]